MARYRKSEYRAEKRNKPVEKPRILDRCQGDMGACVRKDAMAACPRCGKPYCDEHSESHPKYCLGVG